MLAHGFLSLRCGECCHHKPLAFSCRRRGFWPDRGAGKLKIIAVIQHRPVVVTTLTEPRARGCPWHAGTDRHRAAQGCTAGETPSSRRLGTCSRADDEQADDCAFVL